MAWYLLWASLASLLCAGPAVADGGSDLGALPGKLGHLLESLLEPQKPWFHKGLLGSLQICTGDPRPPLWTIRKAGRAAYLLASTSLPAAALEPAYATVREALACADVAYFELPCSMDPAGAATKYFGHCLKYPTYTPLNSIKARLEPADLEALRGAIAHLAEKAQWSCPPASEVLRGAAAALNMSDSRTTLLSMYQGILETLSPTGCDPAGLDFGHTHAEWLRSEFGSDRPSFGLEDVGQHCSLYEGDTLVQDTQLARLMTREFSSSDWFQNHMKSHTVIADMMKCGNLQRLANQRGAIGELPWLRQRLLATRNTAFARGIAEAMEKHNSKTVVAVLGLSHLVDMNGTRSVITSLREMGFIVDQAGGNVDLGCARATPSRPTPTPKQCLAPASFSQPASCQKFRKAFAQALGKDTMYGRTKSGTGCEECSNLTAACTCEVQWTNTSGFEEFCTSFSVDGVKGQVLAMDLVRNPGSVIMGKTQSEKTVRGLYMNCYATSCSTSLIEEMALRSWYSKDPSLERGLVVLRQPGQVFGLSSGGVPPGSFLMWPWWVWPVGLLAVIATVRCLTACFLCRGPRQKGRAATLELPSQYEEHAGKPEPPAVQPAPILLRRLQLMGQDAPLLPNEKVRKWVPPSGNIAMPVPMVFRHGIPPAGSFGGSVHGNSSSVGLQPSRHSFPAERLVFAATSPPPRPLEVSRSPQPSQRGYASSSEGLGSTGEANRRLVRIV